MTRSFSASKSFRGEKKVDGSEKRHKNDFKGLTVRRG